FEVVWGPVRAKDVPRFLKDGMKADENMRRITFSLTERLVLTPVELSLLAKPLIGVLAAVFLVSGFGPGFFSFPSSWLRGLYAAYALVLGIFSGAVVMPLLLPWIPGRSFSLKGGIIGLIFTLFLPDGLSVIELSALMLVVIAASSYLAMNFTGSTPFTSPSGVEKEMRIAIPLQAVSLLGAAILWVLTPFV
ncbi:MAG: mercury methylation corrinoid protein HgcA, partial [Desulfatirhabdiaceae bacterium]|nr:mercury methylation corrinoid protein HgcA [Desulfatirhabdiaceae bacterium]